MSGITDLATLLKSMSPSLQEADYVFVTVAGCYEDYTKYRPLASFREAEGLTLILDVEVANRNNIVYEGIYKQITLNVHSSLEAVGLTAIVASKLAEYNISANVVAAYYHDHIFVQSQNAQSAMQALKELLV